MSEDILYVKHVMIYRRGRKRTLVIEKKRCLVRRDINKDG